MSANYLKSYRRTLVVGVGGTAVALAGEIAAAGWMHTAARAFVLIAIGAAGVLCGILALCTLVVWYRHGHQQRTGTNLFSVLNRSRSEDAIARGERDIGLALRRVARHLIGRPGFIVGELVEIRSYDEIARTLDADGRVGGMPFMPEMRRFCGQRARVFRRVDKIYDYGRSKKLRRLDDVYLLTRLRCDGSAHGGCEAACYLMWKSCWLKPVDPAAEQRNAPPAAVSHEAAAEPAQAAAAPVSYSEHETYVCQFTQLAAASRWMAPRDYRQDLRPLAAGNVTAGAFLLALATRFFNRFQTFRGGVGYPALPNPAAAPPGPPPRALRPGDLVRVRRGAEIARTLDKGGRNRGLWFDADMLNYCGQVCRVRKSVDRIIDDATGRMRKMKSPCIVLEGVDYGGETLRFVAQEEHLYWRDVWLELLESEAESKSSSSPSAGEAS